MLATGRHVHFLRLVCNRFGTSRPRTHVVIPRLIEKVGYGIEIIPRRRGGSVRPLCDASVGDSGRPFFLHNCSCRNDKRGASDLSLYRLWLLRCFLHNHNKTLIMRTNMNTLNTTKRRRPRPCVDAAQPKIQNIIGPPHDRVERPAQ